MSSNSNSLTDLTEYDHEFLDYWVAEEEKLNEDVAAYQENLRKQQPQQQPQQQPPNLSYGNPSGGGGLSRSLVPHGTMMMRQGQSSSPAPVIATSNISSVIPISYPHVSSGTGGSAGGPRHFAPQSRFYQPMPSTSTSFYHMNQNVQNPQPQQQQAALPPIETIFDGIKQEASNRSTPSRPNGPQTHHLDRKVLTIPMAQFNSRHDPRTRFLIPMNPNSRAAIHPLHQLLISGSEALSEITGTTGGGAGRGGKFMEIKTSKRETPPLQIPASSFTNATTTTPPSVGRVVNVTPPPSPYPECTSPYLTDLIHPIPIPVTFSMASNRSPLLPSVGRVVNVTPPPQLGTSSSYLAITPQFPVPAFSFITNATATSTTITTPPLLVGRTVDVATTDTTPPPQVSGSFVSFGPQQDGPTSLPLTSTPKVGRAAAAAAHAPEMFKQFGCAAAVATPGFVTPRSDTPPGPGSGLFPPEPRSATSSTASSASGLRVLLNPSNPANANTSSTSSTLGSSRFPLRPGSLPVSRTVQLRELPADQSVPGHFRPRKLFDRKDEGESEEYERKLRQQKKASDAFTKAWMEEFGSLDGLDDVGETVEAVDGMVKENKEDNERKIKKMYEESNSDTEIDNTEYFDDQDDDDDDDNDDPEIKDVKVEEFVPADELGKLLDESDEEEKQVDNHLPRDHDYVTGGEDNLMKNEEDGDEEDPFTWLQAQQGSDVGQLRDQSDLSISIDPLSIQPNSDSYFEPRTAHAQAMMATAGLGHSSPDLSCLIVKDEDLKVEKKEDVKGEEKAVDPCATKVRARSKSLTSMDSATSSPIRKSTRRSYPPVKGYHSPSPPRAPTPRASSALSAASTSSSNNNKLKSASSSGSLSSSNSNSSFMSVNSSLKSFNSSMKSFNSSKQPLNASIRSTSTSSINSKVFPVVDDPEKMEKRRLSERARRQERLANETPEQKEARCKKRRDAERRKREGWSDQKWEEYRSKRRIERKNYNKKKKEGGGGGGGGGAA